MTNFSFKVPHVGLLNIFIVTGFPSTRVEEVQTNENTTNRDPEAATEIRQTKRKKGKRGKKTRRKKQDVNDGTEDEVEQQLEATDQLESTYLGHDASQAPVVEHRQYIELLADLRSPRIHSLIPQPLASKHERELLQTRPRCENCQAPATEILQFKPDAALTTPGEIQYLLARAEAAGQRGHRLVDRAKMNIVKGPMSMATSKEEALKIYGLYKPFWCAYVSYACDDTGCIAETLAHLANFVTHIETQWITDYNMNAEPHTTAFGRPTCQVCVDENVMWCGNNCGFAYCSREHQMIDRPRHKSVCKLRAGTGKPEPSKSPLACYVFFGDPRKKLQYHSFVVEVPSDWINKAREEFYDDLDEKLRAHTNFLFRTTDGKYVDCVVCSKAASWGLSYLSYPILETDDNFEDRAVRFEEQLARYHEKDAFVDEDLETIKTNFRIQAPLIAQCHILVMPVCDEACEAAAANLEAAFKDGMLTDISTAMM